MNKTMTADQFSKLFPRDWVDDTDNSGQIIIYTGLTWSDDFTVVERFVDDDE